MIRSSMMNLKLVVCMGAFFVLFGCKFSNSQSGVTEIGGTFNKMSCSQLKASFNNDIEDYDTAFKNWQADAACQASEPTNTVSPTPAGSESSSFADGGFDAEASNTEAASATTTLDTPPSDHEEDGWSDPYFDDTGAGIGLTNTPITGDGALASIDPLPIHNGRAIVETSLNYECRNKYRYLKKLYTDLTAAKRQYIDVKGCDDRSSNDGVSIIDYPACKVGCINGERSCYTCNFKYFNSRNRDLYNSAPADLRGRITCESEADAKREIRRWCDLQGYNCLTGDQQVTCNVADALDDTNRGSAGITIKMHRFTANLTTRAYANVSGEIPGVGKGKAEVSLKTGDSVSVSISVRGNNNAAMVRRYGREEGGPNSQFYCSIERASFEAVAGKAGVEVGFKFLGNGASAGVEIEVEGKATVSNIGRSPLFSAVGKTFTQMESQCVTWGIDYMKTVIANGIVKPLTRIASAVAGKWYKLTTDTTTVYCTYPDLDKSYAISNTFIKFSGESAEMFFEHHLDYWEDKNSPKHTVKTSELVPYQDGILDNSISNQGIAELLTNVLAPRTGNDGKKWHISNCWVD